MWCTSQWSVHLCFAYFNVLLIQVVNISMFRSFTLRLFQCLDTDIEHMPIVCTFVHKYYSNRWFIYIVHISMVCTFALCIVQCFVHLRCAYSKGLYICVVHIPVVCTFPLCMFQCFAHLRSP